MSSVTKIFLKRKKTEKNKRQATKWENSFS